MAAVAEQPFGLLAAALGSVRPAADPRRAAIAGLLASQGAGDLGPITVTSDSCLRFRVVDAFTDLVEELALAVPLVLGLDDLQWADPSSLLTVGVLARRLADLPVGVIGCVRPSPRRRTGPAGRCAGGCRRAASGPESPDRGGGEGSGGAGGGCRAGPAAAGSGVGASGCSPRSPTCAPRCRPRQRPPKQQIRPKLRPGGHRKNERQQLT